MDAVVEIINALRVGLIHECKVTQMELCMTTCKNKKQGNRKLVRATIESLYTGTMN
jgi:hypothetical protein